MNKRDLILFIDSGDTLVDEGTQEWDDQEVVIKTSLLVGAATALRLIHERGYTIALVADGKNQSFENVYTAHGLRSCFDAWIVSETLGASKPSARMFQAALDALNLTDQDKGRIVMVGNNLSRDVLGANRFGITSLWIDWSPRYSHEPATPDEVPDYTIRTPPELPPLLEKLDAALRRGEAIKP